jgi:hypothetical protein
MMGRLQMMMANAARPMEPTEFRFMSRTHYPDEARIFGIYCPRLKSPEGDSGSEPWRRL